MRVFCSGIFLMGTAYLSFAQPKISPTHSTNLTQTIDDSRKSKSRDSSTFNGFAVSIVDDKGTLYQTGLGFSDVDSKKAYTEHTIQNIASISKVFVGIALLKAQESGELHLDDPIEKHLPFRIVHPDFPQTKITIRHLATHTSSIVDNEYYLSKNYVLKSEQALNEQAYQFDDTQTFLPYDSLIPLSAFLENILSPLGKWYQPNSFTEHPPGTHYDYSNIGTALAAWIVELATGIPFERFTHQYIFEPLEMNATGWKFEDIDFSQFSTLYETNQKPIPFYQTITYPDGGLISSVNDLSKFLTELIKGYQGNGTLLTKESYLEYFTPQLSETHFSERNIYNPYSESYNTGIFIGYGYTGYIGHTGGDPGVVSIMFFEPAKNLGRIMIFNTSISDQKGNDLFYKIWDILEKHHETLTR